VAVNGRRSDPLHDQLDVLDVVVVRGGAAGPPPPPVLPRARRRGGALFDAGAFPGSVACLRPLRRPPARPLPPRPALRAPWAGRRGPREGGRGGAKRVGGGDPGWVVVGAPAPPGGGGAPSPGRAPRRSTWTIRPVRRSRSSRLPGSAVPRVLDHVIEPLCVAPAP